jgi:hypothetical protein
MKLPLENLHRMETKPVGADTENVSARNADCSAMPSTVASPL